MSNNGRLNFGVYPGSAKVITTPTAYNDGQWHMFSASLSSDGMAFYVDGRLIGRDRTVTTAQAYNGYWRIGGDSLASSWPNAPTSAYLSGTLDDVATYPTALTAAAVNDLYVKSGRPSTVPATTPGDAYGADTYNGNPTLYWRLGEAAGPVAADSSSSDNRGLYQGTPTYGQTGALTTSTDKAVGVGTGSSLRDLGVELHGAGGVHRGTVVQDRHHQRRQADRLRQLGHRAQLQRRPQPDHDERGQGPLRHPERRDPGQRRLARCPTTTTSGTTRSPPRVRTACSCTSTARWSATDPNAASSTFTGYWRAGYDTVWSGSSSNYFAGSIDEVAVYPRALSLTEIKTKFRDGGGTVANTPPVASVQPERGRAERHVQRRRFVRSGRHDHRLRVELRRRDHRHRGRAAAPVRAAGDVHRHADGDRQRRCHARRAAGRSRSATRHRRRTSPPP